ncbi:MAG: hypothetical protein ACLRMJ_07060 [Alistipes finegoldii]
MGAAPSIPMTNITLCRPAGGAYAASADRLDAVYRAVQTTSDLYAEHTAFNLPYVSVKRRGLNYRDESASVGVVRLSSRYFGRCACWGR